MRYVRTDASTVYMLWLNSHWIVYNPPTKRFFVTDPAGSRVYALDAATETLVGSIPVPGAFGIDDTPDHSLLYVGTQIGDVYAIDPVSMTVTHRYLASQIGPKGFQAYSVQVMADGRLALLGGQGGIPGVDGYTAFAIWSPADNSLSLYTTSRNEPTYSSIPNNVVCGPLENIGVFTRTPDRSKVVISSIDSDSTLCEVDESSGADQYVQIATSFIYHLAISPDGSFIAIPYGPNGDSQVLVLDAHTLAQVAVFPIAGDNGSDAMYFIGPDSKTLYVPFSFSTSDSGGVANSVLAYDISTGQQIGWFPNIYVEPPASGFALGPIYGPQFQAMDGTGLLAGPMEEGVGFLDTTTLQTGPIGTQFSTDGGFTNPGTGSTSGGTQTSWSAWPADQVSLTDVYFGSQHATGVSTSISTTAPAGTYINATSPPGAPGPADIYALDSDGGIQYLPEGFSYGPTILQVTPNASTADGGGTGIIYGYGFGPATATSTAVPSGLTVGVGQHPGKVTSFTPNPYNLLHPPLPLQAFTYTIPSGQAGSTEDVTVTSSSGSATVKNAMRYLPAIQQYSAPGAELAQGVYDPYNDLYYFTDATGIRVFSLADHLWQPPIPIPAADNPQRLWGIALSPDGSKMAVADAQGEAIYVLSPGSASAPQKFPVPQPLTGVVRNPIGVAISNAGIVYFTAETTGGTGYNVFFKLDTGSGQVTDYGIGTNSPLTDSYSRTILKADNSLVYGNDDGAVFSVDTTTDKVSYEQTEPGCCYGNYELALSSDQTRLAATNYFYDANLNAESYFALNDREAMNISYIYGQKLSPDGRLLFQPTTLGIDVMDGHLGTLLDRIALPVALSPNYDALVSDGKDNVLVAITGANGDGIAVIDLSSIPEPAPLTYNPAMVSTTGITALKTAPATRRIKRLRQAGTQPQPEPGRRIIPHVTVQHLLLRPR